MSTYNITVTNNALGCTAEIEQQLIVSGCSTYIVRLASNSNALGPFDVYVDSGIYYSGVTRDNMLMGVTVTLQCETPTPTPTPTPTETTNYATPTPTPTNTETPTQTPTNTPTNTETPTNTPTPGLSPSQTPTNTETPTPTPTNTETPTQTPTNTETPTPTPTITPTASSPAFYAYIFPEPQDSVSLNDLGYYMYNSGATAFFGWGNSGTPAGSSYSDDMAIYVQYSGWTGSSGNFVTNASTFTGEIKQSTGASTDSYGCPQTQYAFGSVPILTSQVNSSIQYTYTVWVPLNGVGGVLNNMTIDVGIGSACSISIINDGVPDAVNASVDVIVPSGCVIPSGTYRILWMIELFSEPSSPPLASTLWIKGDTKS